MKQFIRYPWVVAVRNIALMMLIYTLSRVFFYLISLDVYPSVSIDHLIEMLVGGLRFDVTALFYLNSLYMAMVFLPLPWRTHTVYQRVLRWTFWIPNLIGIFVNCVDMVYVRFSARRTTVAFFSEFEHDSNLGQILWQGTIEYWYVTLFALAMIAACILLYSRTMVPTPLQERMQSGKAADKWRFYLHGAMLFAVSVYFIVIGIRSGFGSYTRPITLSNALQYTQSPAETNIVLNTPFCLMRSIEGGSYTHPEYMSDAEMAETMTPYHPADTTHTFTPKNVVILIVESLSKEYIGYYNQDLLDSTYQGYTPFLDSLLPHTITYRYSYSSGRKSIDAMPSILSSLPRLGEPYILTPYSTNDVPSLAWSLRDKGYHTAFFHGAPNGSMGFMAYARSSGFQEYYGKSEYNHDEDYDGYWAIWDEEFLQYYAHTMSEFSEPFFTSVFTATSHHPFQLPARYEGVFPEGTLPIHRCIGYVDMSLKRFFETAKQQPWYSNTLFVLTADHTNALAFPEYLNDRGGYEVPIIFFDPSWESRGKMIETYPMCQADIMASVLSYLNYDQAYYTFGEDGLTKSKNPPYIVVYNEPVYQVISPQWMVQMDQEGNLITIFDIHDRRLTSNCLEQQDNPEIRDMVHYAKAYIQQYNIRMITNSLTRSIDDSTSR